MSTLSASLEDYLEVIGQLEQTDRVARARDIADRMNVNRSSVTHALKELSAKGLINYDPYSFVTLTDQGKNSWQQIAHRHHILMRFLNEILGLAPEIADRNACLMEHAVDVEGTDRVAALLDFFDRRPRTRNDWNKKLKRFLPGGKTSKSKAGTTN